MKDRLIEFILRARRNTYASGGGKVTPSLKDSVQLEYTEDDFMYRDVYFIGNSIFNGIEAVYFEGKVVWSMSYFGDMKNLTEDEADKILRKALIDNWNTTRLWNDVQAEYDNFIYVCKAKGSIDKMSGVEEILKEEEAVYSFTFNGGFIG